MNATQTELDALNAGRKEPTDWYNGYCAYVDGHMRFECSNDEERAGYDYAMKGQVASDIFAIALEAGYDAQDDIDRDICQTIEEMKRGLG